MPRICYVEKKFSAASEVTIAIADLATQLAANNAEIDGLLDKRVAAAQDTGNLAGRAEMRSEQADDRAEARSPAGRS